MTLRPAEWSRVVIMGLVVLVLNGFGWGVYALMVLPHHPHYEKLGVGLGVAFTAWTLGARHAFDADHISAIDNATRKLLGDGKRPLATGFYFSLGHSAVVVAVAVGITVAAKPAFGALVNPDSAIERVGGMLPEPPPPGRCSRQGTHRLVSLAH